MNKKQILGLFLRPFLVVLFFLIDTKHKETVVLFFKKLFNAEFAEQALEPFYDKFVSGSITTQTNIEELLLTIPIRIRSKINLGEQSERGFFLYGYSPWLTKIWEYSDSQTAFFDIGANVGFISLALAKKIDPKNIFAFEPVADTYKKLIDNLKLNQVEINAFNFGLSRSDCKMSFAIAKGHSGGSTSNIKYMENSLRELGQKHNLKIIECQLRSFDNLIRDKVITLNGNINKVIIKIDVEGAENEVIEGMKNFLSDIKLDCVLVVETKSDNIKTISEILNKLGFVIDKTSSELNYESFYKDVFFKKDSLSKALTIEKEPLVVPKTGSEL